MESASTAVSKSKNGRSPLNNKNKDVIIYQRRRFRHGKNTRPTQDNGVDGGGVDVGGDDVSIKIEKDHLPQNKNHGHEMPKIGFVYVYEDYYDVKSCLEEGQSSSKCDQCSLPFQRIDGNLMQERSGDSEVQILDIAAFGEKQIACPFVSAKKYHPSMFGEDSMNACDVASDEFRAEVLSVLRKPFDKEEYSKYRKEIKDGCYLHHHSDLKRKLKKYRYKQTKCMVIMRGFFFWLQNLTREGAFRPWEDKECLAVEPMPAS